jgi:hypothetical protein
MLGVIGGVTYPLAGCLVNIAIDCEHALVDCSATGTSAACVPGDNPEPVDDGCGIFVSSSRGQDTNAGTKSAPLKTLQQALDQAKGRPIYACAEAFAGSVTLASGSALYGGVDCAKNWAYVGATTKTALTGDADKPALTIAKAAGRAEVADFAIQAANAMAAGGSSIAVFAAEVTAHLTRCDLVAGDGAPGVDGEDAPSTLALAGANGNPGGNACLANTVNGGAQVENDCAMESSVGGRGGDGNKSNGGSGQAGFPADAGGQAGRGDDGSVGWSCAGSGGTGGQGLPGEAGMPGASASMSSLGTLTASGFTPVGGGEGKSGKIGQGGGGGGGGGAKGGTLECSGRPGTGGASGGAGGAGGCGGAGGKGGKGGGASIALVSLKAGLTLTDVTLKTGTGGMGGTGGNSQAGGAGGLGGTGGSNLSSPDLNAGCKGGDGGNGGNGGPGGGGRGGHSIGLAYSGTAPTFDPKQVTVGTAGAGGPGGNKSLKGNQGADGVAVPLQAFP